MMMFRVYKSAMDPYCKGVFSKVKTEQAGYIPSKLAKLPKESILMSVTWETNSEEDEWRKTTDGDPHNK